MFSAHIAAVASAFENVATGQMQHLPK